MLRAVGCPRRPARSPNALPIISTTGSSTVASVSVERGDDCSRCSGAASYRSPAGTGTHRSANRAKTGPATTIVGIATRMPSASVQAEVGVDSLDGCQRSGVRAVRIRASPRRPARAYAQSDDRPLCPLGDQEHHRHQEDETDLEEHRQPDDRADRGHRPGQHPRPRFPTMVSTIWSAPPESASSLPNIAPSAIRPRRP